MLSNKEIICPNNLLDEAHKKKGVKVAVVNAGKPLPMLSVQDAVNENLVEPIFIGNKEEIKKCAEDIKWDISSYEIIHEPVENRPQTFTTYKFLKITQAKIQMIPLITNSNFVLYKIPQMHHSFILKMCQPKSMEKLYLYDK